MKTSDNIDARAGDIHLGGAIKQAREALGLSLRQLAEAVDVHHSFLARLESGDYQTAKPAFLQRLSRVLEIDERDLFSLAGLDAPEGLPSFTPYLRAKYDMSDEAAKALHEYFLFVSDKYDVRTKQEPPAA
jgi:transcriptional regulator with XRE-family HTH domain